MHDYKGVDGTLYVPTNYANKGVWVTPQVPDDGNDRSAQTVAVGIEAVADRTVYLAFHMVDGLKGGSYAADFGWTGGHLFSGSVTLTDVVTMTNNVTIGGTLGVTGNVTCSNNLLVLGTTSLIGAFSVVGNSTFSGFVTFSKEVTFNDPLVVNDTFERVGDDAWEGLRSGDGPDATTTIQPWKQDVWSAASVTDDREWTLANPPTGKVIRATFRRHPTHNVVLKDAGGNTLINIGDHNSGFYKIAVLVWDKTAWFKESSLFEV